MAMPIPPVVTVGGRTYTIHSDEETSRLTSDDGSRGMTFTERLRIHLNAEMPDDLIRETLLHECMHAAWDFVGLGKAGAIAEHEEQAIKALAPVLVDMLRRNPEIVAYLVGRG